MIKSRQIKNVFAYQTLENELRQMILRNELQYDRAITPETELAQQYNIGRNTARKALSNLEKEGLIRKIHGRGTFVIHPDQRPGEARVKLEITLVIPEDKSTLSGNFYDRNLVAGVREHIFMSNTDLTVTNPAALSFKSLYSSFSSGNLNGIIWERPSKEIFPLIEKLRDKKVPQVTISRSIPSIPSVFFDVDRSIQETIKFLTKIGHRNIAFIDLNQNYPIFINRQRTFLEMLRKMGNECPEKYLCLFAKPVNYDEKLDLIPPVTAIIASSFIIDHLYSWFDRKGFNVPEDVSLIALSAENSIELKNHPEMSAIIDPRREIGKVAMEMLEEIISGQEVSIAPRKIRGELIMRKSCISPFSKL
jgi:DNA-binding LacI/PurR family transcriptional regulator